VLSDEDRRLLNLIAQDCRLTPEELSIQTGLSVDYITKQIKKWEEDKVIVSYRPLINWERLDEGRVMAIIELKVLPERGHGFDRIASRIKKYPQIKTVFLVSGGFDIVIIAEGKSMQDVASFVAEKLATLENVQSTATHFILRRYKQDGVDLEGQEEAPQRLVISP